MKANTLRGALYGIGAASIWGGMYVVSDQVLLSIGPFSLLAIRLFIGALIFVVFTLMTGRIRIPARKALKLMAVGALGYGISVGAQFVGTDLANSLNGSVITSASPAFILLFAWLILREPLTRTHIAAVALASLGVLIILDLAQFDLSSRFFQGNLALALAALTWGAYSVLVRRVSADHPTLLVTTYGLLGGFVFVLPAGIFQTAQQPIPPLDVNLILGILYLGVVSTAGAMWLWNRAFALVEASAASLFFFAQPLVGVLLSNLLLQQPITPPIVIGGALIIGGVLLSMREPKAERAPAREEAREPQSSAV